MSLVSVMTHLFVAFTVAYALLMVMISGRLPVALDRPNERSLHRSAVPRTGGVAVVVGLAVSSGVGQSDGILALVGTAIALGLVSLLDDFRGLPPAMRLVAHLAAAVLVVLRFPFAAPILHLVFVVLLIAWMINLYNFMDGANGLAGGMAVLGFAAYAAVSANAGMADVALLSAAVAAAALAFLRFNFHPARIFLGDVGSVPLGFLAGSLGYLGWQRGAWPAWFPGLVFSPFVVDATITLLRRLVRGERIWQAHREHCYQKLIRMGWSHRRTALAEYGLMLTVAVLASRLLKADVDTVAAALTLVVTAYALIIVCIEVKWRRFHHASRP